jgi:sialidase-1
MAAAALARCGSRPALAGIRESLGGADRDAAQIAAWILAQIGAAEDRMPLRTRLEQETDPLKRAYLVNALATLGDDTGKKQLFENLNHADGAVRTYSAEFAGHARMAVAADKLIKLLDDPITDVRVRAAQSLLALSQPPIDRDAVIVRDVFPAKARNPRYSEGSIIERADGSLLFAITEFVGAGEDHSTAQIAARTSTDGGRSWGDSCILQPNVGTQNVMSVTLCRLKQAPIGAAPIAMFYLVKNGPTDLKVWLRVSSDEGKSFGDPIVVTDAPGYHVMNNDRVLRLRSGRLVCPISWTADVAGASHFVACCYLSDDGGTSWRRSSGSVDLPRRGAMEPETLELNDGRLLMILRTQLGTIYASYSADQGLTWSKAATWNVVAPEAPATLRRIPATGDLLLIYNPVYRAGAGHGGPRTPLVLAISADEGATWRQRADLETATDQTYAYTSATFVKDRLLLSYYVAEEKSGRISTRFQSIPISRLYR